MHPTEPSPNPLPEYRAREWSLRALGASRRMQRVQTPRHKPPSLQNEPNAAPAKPPKTALALRRTGLSLRTRVTPNETDPPPRRLCPPGARRGTTVVPHERNAKRAGAYQGLSVKHPADQPRSVDWRLGTMGFSYADWAGVFYPK